MHPNYMTPTKMQPLNGLVPGVRQLRLRISRSFAVKTISYRCANDGVLRKASQPCSTSRLEIAIDQRITDDSDRERCRLNTLMPTSIIAPTAQRA